MTTSQDTCRIARHRNGYQLLAHSRIGASLDDVFAFFCDAGNLDELTPPFLRFRVLTPEPIDMKVGTLIDYSLRLRGFPIRWQSEITAWEPPYRFVDEQRRGPYRVWVHEHRFEEVDGETSVIDQVDYAVLGGPVIHRLLVRRDLMRIFSYRRQRLIEIFMERNIPAVAEQATRTDVDNAVAKSDY